jgi:hypothetical protein
VHSFELLMRLEFVSFKRFRMIMIFMRVIAFKVTLCDERISWENRFDLFYSHLFWVQILYILIWIMMIRVDLYYQQIKQNSKANASWLLDRRTKIWKYITWCLFVSHTVYTITPLLRFEGKSLLTIFEMDWSISQLVMVDYSIYIV